MDAIINITEKTCSKCGEAKPLDKFSHEKRTKDKRRAMCKECSKEEYQKWCTNNREYMKKYVKQYRKLHPVKVANYNYKNKTEEQKKQIKINARNWQKSNPEKVRSIALRWYYKNHSKAKEAARKYQMDVLNTKKGKLNSSMRKRIAFSLRNHSKARQHWELLVGYTVDQLREHLEKQFKDGMTWGNIGKWHIDHKIPLSVFNFNAPEDIDFKKAWALKNLQPLWAKENISKGARITNPFQPSLALAA